MSLRAEAKALAAAQGISVDAARSMLRRHGKRVYTATKAQQDGCCAICGTGGKLVLDHNHATGAFRGWLCGPCNTGLGMFRDSPVYLRAAAEYLSARGPVLSAEESTT